MTPGELDKQVDRIADAAPPLTDQQRARLSALLRPVTSKATDSQRKAA